MSVVVGGQEGKEGGKEKVYIYKGRAEHFEACVGVCISGFTITKINTTCFGKACAPSGLSETVA